MKWHSGFCLLLYIWRLQKNLAPAFICCLSPISLWFQKPSHVKDSQTDRCTLTTEPHVTGQWIIADMVYYSSEQLYRSREARGTKANNHSTESRHAPLGVLIHLTPNHDWGVSAVKFTVRIFQWLKLRCGLSSLWRETRLLEERVASAREHGIPLFSL